MICKTILFKNLYNYKPKYYNYLELNLDLVISFISNIGFLSIHKFNNLQKDIQVKKGTANLFIHFILLI
jgi:hypothetical protein